MKKFMIMVLAAGMLMMVTNVVFAADDDKGRVNSLNASVTVPNVVGKSLVEGINILTAAGLKRETQLSDRDGEKRVIVRQDPIAGARVAPGSIVKIYGQLVSVPPAAQNVDEKGRVNIPRK
jgi:beta-lactam-binding protein with PASTA domain